MASKKDNKLFEDTGVALATSFSSSSPAVKKVQGLCLEAEALAETIENLEELLKSAKARDNIIKTQELPEAVSELGTTEWKSENGRYEVSVDSFVSGTLPKDPDRREAAIEWLTEHDGAAMVKTEIVMAFGKQDREYAEKMIASLKKSKAPFEVTEGVHPQTLLAYVRERMEDGEPVDLDVLGIYSGRKAKLKINEPKEATVERVKRKK